MWTKSASIPLTPSRLLSKVCLNQFFSLSLGKCPDERKRHSKNQCLGKKPWPVIKNIKAWMISSETATFMKVGGLGVVATELPTAFNEAFSKQGDEMVVVTPLYLGDTKRKKSFLRKKVYTSAENCVVDVHKMATIHVPFVGKNNVINSYKVDIYGAQKSGVSYVFLSNKRFFTITTNYRNPDCQDGCYVYNKLGVNEVERFAFFSKAVYVLLKTLCADEKAIDGLECPNVLLANDWHSGALAGLTKCLTKVQQEKGQMSAELAEKISNIPVIHLAHHLGYQGWDGKNTVRLLNALYEDCALDVLNVTGSCLENNQRVNNCLLVDNIYNQAGCNFHLADRVVTVSKNYSNEVCKGTDFGYDFCHLLEMRKEHGTFMGIVNGYDKKRIVPNPKKIGVVNTLFSGAEFCCYDEDSIEIKNKNKREFIKLLSKLATDEMYRQQTLPLLNFYKFEDISDLEDCCDSIPMCCATSRLVEQKGYDIVAKAIIDLYQNKKIKEAPIFILGGAGDMKCFEHLIKLKDKVSEINQEAGRRIFVFQGYKDPFAYAIQLASDFYMMPCRFEPCGLTQMEAMAKGSLPIAMSTGGLVDTIDDGVDGFRTKVFFGDTTQIYGSEKDGKLLKNNVQAYADVLVKALEVFAKEPQKLQQMAKKAMYKDFGWTVENGSIYKYYNLLKTGHL